MATSDIITDILIQKSIVRAVQNVCRTMIRLEIDLIDPPPEDTVAPPRDNYVFGSVGFIGEINGLVYLGLPDEFAKDITARILGMSPGEVASHGHTMVNDVIGEFTNITAGGFKNALCDVGFPCKLTLPSIVRGENVSVVANKAATRHLFHFSCAGHRLVADIQLKIE